MINPKISELLERIRRLQDEIEQEVQHRRAELHADFEHRRIRFEREVLEQQRRFRAGLLAYIFGAQLRHVITAPVIYAVFIPLVLADFFVTVYQHVCFPFYRIPRVRRSEHFIYDRSHLGYLNLIEKLNCAYCAYANGFASYIREIVARTEQYWCPIKHARRMLHAHPYYDGFVDYGDAEGYRRELARLRAELESLGARPGN
jgi:hypothetical protein